MSDDPSVPAPRGELVHGFRGPEACMIAGVTYRQLDYWARTQLVEPSVRPAKGSGTQRLYSRRDVAALKLSRSMLDAGLSLQCVRVLLPDLLAAYDGRALQHAQLDQRGYVSLVCGDVTICVDIMSALTSVSDPPLVSDERRLPPLHSV